MLEVFQQLLIVRVDVLPESFARIVIGIVLLLAEALGLGLAVVRILFVIVVFFFGLFHFVLGLTDAHLGIGLPSALLADLFDHVFVLAGLVRVLPHVRIVLFLLLVHLEEDHVSLVFALLLPLGENILYVDRCREAKCMLQTFFVVLVVFELVQVVVAELGADLCGDLPVLEPDRLLGLSVAGVDLRVWSSGGVVASAEITAHY